MGAGLFGLPERIRTFDLQSRSLTRYPAVPRVDVLFAAHKKRRNGNIIPQSATLDKVFAKKFLRQSFLPKLFFKKLLTNLGRFAIISLVPNIGVSPSGKASDSDSDISGVRIPAPQPRKKQIAKAICFFQLYSPAASSIASQ